MSEIREHVEYLSQTIGARPAGTEEEQQAALYIADTLNKETGLSASIEDFNCNPDFDLPMVICSGIAVVVAIVAMIVPVMAIPALILTLIAALLFVAEAFDRPVLSRFFNKGVSQNVVAKYVPEAGDSSASARRRKIILVAHYDSGRIRKDVNGPLFGLLPKIKWIALGGMAALPVLFLVRCLISFGGVGLIVINVITGIAVACVAINLLLTLLARTANYNQAANCNAAGVAVLMDVAARVSESAARSFDTTGLVSDETEGEDLWFEEGSQEFGETDAHEGGVSGFLTRSKSGEVVMHGEEAAIEEGLVPEDAEFVYEAAPAEEIVPEDDSPAARLLAAKAAIAAMTGMPVSNTINIDLPTGKEEAEVAEAEAAFNDALAESFEFEGFGLGEGVAHVLAAGEGHASTPGADLLGAAVETAAEAVETVEVAEVAAAATAAVATAAAVTPSGKPMPDWFVKAQQKAKKPAEEAPIQRSRYADALDAANALSASQLQPQPEEPVASDMEQRLQEMRDSIMEVKAPVLNRTEAQVEVEIPVEDEPVSAPAVEEVVEEVAEEAAPVAQPVRKLQLSLDPVAKPEAEQPAQLEAGAFVPTVIKAEKPAEDPIPQPVAAPEEPAAPAEPVKPAPRRRLAISLPSMMGEEPAEQQPAQPEAEPAPKPKQPTRRVPEPVAGTGRMRSLRSALPSIGATGAIAPIPAEEEAPALDPSSTVAFSCADLQSTGSFEPADLSGFGPEEEPIEGTENYEVESYEDGAYEDEYYDEYEAGSDENAEGGYEDEYGYYDDYTAPAAPEYMEMPKSRASSFLDKFRFGRKKKEEHQGSPQEWLNVDDEFDARSAGAARGGWESFLEEEDETPSRRGSRRKWNGGAFSRIKLGRINKSSGEEEIEPQDEQWSDEWDGAGDQWDDQVYDSYDSYDSYNGAFASLGLPLQDEVEQIMEFRNPQLNTEVWFVALGSELASNGGMKAFLTEHASELKGAVIVEIDGMGAGELSIIDKEGTYKKRTTSSRMKRYVKKAGQAFGMSIPAANMLWANSSAAYAMQRGHQVMHVAGMLDGKPAYFGHADDVLDNVDEEMLALSSDFVVELLHQI